MPTEAAARPPHRRARAPPWPAPRLRVDDVAPAERGDPDRSRADASRAIPPRGRRSARAGWSPSSTEVRRPAPRRPRGGRRVVPAGVHPSPATSPPPPTRHPPIRPADPSPTGGPRDFATGTRASAPRPWTGGGEHPPHARAGALAGARAPGPGRPAVELAVSSHDGAVAGRRPAWAPGGRGWSAGTRRRRARDASMAGPSGRRTRRQREPAPRQRARRRAARPPQRIAADRQELRQQRDVEDADLRVEQVGGQPLRAPATPMPAPPPPAAPGAADRRPHEQADAEPDQVGRTGVPQHVVGQFGRGQQRGDPTAAAAPQTNSPATMPAAVAVASRRLRVRRPAGPAPCPAPASG